MEFGDIFDQQNKTVYTVLIIFLIVYTPMLKIELPDTFRAIFDNYLFKFCAMALIAFRFTGDQRASLVVALCLMLLWNKLNEMDTLESFVNKKIIMDSLEQQEQQEEMDEEPTYDELEQEISNETIEEKFTNFNNEQISDESIPDPIDDGKYYAPNENN